MIKCKVCGKSFKYSKGKFKPKSLLIHARRVHKLENYQYVSEYEHTDFKFEQCGWCDRIAIPEIVFENKKLRLKYNKYLCNDEKCKENRKKYNPRSYLATQKTYKMSEKEAKEYVSKKSPFHRAYFESDSEYKESQSVISLDKFQKRHGKEKGEIKFLEYCELRKHIASPFYYIEKLGEEEGRKKWAKISKSKAITRKKMIEKYGEEGNKKYESFLDKTLKNFVSKMSIECLDFISEKCSLSIRHGRNNSEKKIRCKKSTRPVDGYCEDLNIVFEFYGDRWHMNPSLYSSVDLNPRKKKASDIWNEDRIRLNDILPEVKAIFIIWEYDWMNNKERIVKRLRNLLTKLKNKKLDQSVYFL